MRTWLPLTAICLGAFMLLCDVTIVNVALPSIAADLRSTYADLQWVLDLYALALATLVLGAGTLADKLGRRAVYVVGLVFFCLASLACGLTPSATFLVVARGLQGIGGAAMFATTVALLNHAYQGRQRGVAFAIYGAVLSAAAASGPLLGGVLTEAISWRAIFLVNLPIGGAAAVLALRYVEESRNPRARRLDLAGMAAFVLAAGGVTFGLVWGATSGWAAPLTWGGFGAGALGGTLFVIAERLSPAPMVDLRLFASRPFTGAMVGALLLSASAFAVLPYLSIWLQSVLGLSPLEGGLALIPMSITSFLVSALAGARLQRLPAGWTVGSGLFLVGCGMLLLWWLSRFGQPLALLPGLLVLGCGVGAATATVISAAMASVPVERSGMAGGAVNTARQLGQALGVAALGAVFTARVEAELGRLGVAHAQAVAQAAAGGGAPALLAGAPAAVRPLLARWLEIAVSQGVGASCLAAGLGGLVAALLTLLLLGRRRAAQAGTSSSEVA